jgi:hypothetical protein
VLAEAVVDAGRSEAVAGAHTKLRDLIRTRLAEVRAVRTARQQSGPFLLRDERIDRNGRKLDESTSGMAGL